VSFNLDKEKYSLAIRRERERKKAQGQGLRSSRMAAAAAAAAAGSGSSSADRDQGNPSLLRSFNLDGLANSINSSSSSSGDDEELPLLPENVLENLFTYLDLSDIRSVASVCPHWYGVVRDENGEVWRSFCLQKMERESLSSELLTSCGTFKAKLRAFFHAWNPLDCSRNIFVKSNGFTIHRNPVAQSTDGARGKVGFTRGRHRWEVKWEGPLGTVAVVGVATSSADLRAQGYIALLGKDDQSWGWNLVENVLLHNGETHGNYPLVNNAPRYQVGERITVLLDCEDNTLSFEKNDEFLGVAFRGLPQEELYPAVSAVYGNSEISMVYLGPPLDG